MASLSAQTKKCQNCGVDFTIEPEDFEFYEKMKVPAPTWCPECRMIRRMAWRNERMLYKRPCNVPGHTESIASIYSQDVSLTVYDQEHWWSDKWDSLQYGREYDFSRPFFEQFLDLLKVVPLPALDSAQLSTIENCQFCNDVWSVKNCYYCTTVGRGEELYYCFWVGLAKNIYDSFRVLRSENCYEGVDLEECYNVHFARNARNCIDSHFLFDCRSCTNCFGCVGLRNKQYCIFNKQLDKETYNRKFKEYFPLRAQKRDEILEHIHKLSLQIPRRYANIVHSDHVIGENITNSKNCQFCFDVEDAENSKFLSRAILGIKDSHDLYNSGERAELSYEDAVTGIQVSRCLFSIYAVTGQNIQYSFNVHNVNNVFGCVGIRSKEYCVLNKQYTQEEYNALVPRIIKHMNSTPYIDAKGRVYTYGEFFPSELSPFAYNETMAHECFPLTKEDAVSRGFAWKDPEVKSYAIMIAAKDLPDNIKNVSDLILKETIGCEHAGGCNEQCSTAFRIIPQELEFYRKMSLPLPRLCPNCRHYQRLKQRNPLKLWHRKCQCAGKKSEARSTKSESSYTYENTIEHFHKQNPCPNEFETSYAPDRPEIIYCEQCYQAEIV